MKINKINILLISYVFPPYYGIGGRRWAKHANELTKMGYTVHVICAKNPFKQRSLWTDLVVENPNIILHQVPARFPDVLVRFDHRFLEKLIYRFWIIVLPLFTKGSYLDRSIFWKRVMTRKARQLISEKKIRNVICSGGPFGAMYQTTLLKRYFEDIFIINDLRDPWTWAPNWGFQKLKRKRMEHELFLEKKTIEDSDLITVPTLELKRQLDERYPLHKNKIKTLFHFFDKSEIVVEEKTKSKRLRLVFYGTIYHHIIELIEETAATIAMFKDSISLDIYTDRLQCKGVFEKYGASNVTFHDQLPPNQLFKLFKNYDYVFLMIPGVGVDHISTKFYEIIYTKTPFLIFSKYGLAPEFVLKNNLGIHAEINGLRRVFEKLVNDKEYKAYNSEFDLDKYSLENNARQIESMFVSQKG